MLMWGWLMQFSAKQHLYKASVEHLAWVQT